MKLSDAFDGDDHSLELKLTAYNINYGLGQELLLKCDFLKDYSLFVNKVKEGIKNGLSINGAIRRAINYCIEQGIMKEYLLENAKEVFNMSMLEYNENDAHAAWRAEAREEGIEEGIIKTAINMLKENIPLDIIARVTSLSTERILLLK